MSKYICIYIYIYCIGKIISDIVTTKLDEKKIIKFLNKLLINKDVDFSKGHRDEIKAAAPLALEDLINYKLNRSETKITKAD